jgi:hypothetical protein
MSPAYSALDADVPIGFVTRGAHAEVEFVFAWFISVTRALAAPVSIDLLHGSWFLLHRDALMECLRSHSAIRFGSNR